jgi:hypothetical protein
MKHIRLHSVASDGARFEACPYESWGNPISPPAERIDQPFTWNGAYGWTYTPFTGLYHLNPDYDPRTARYLQRQGSNPTNPYITADNDPLNNLDENTSLLTGVKRDVSWRGRQMAQQLKVGAKFVTELHPGVLAMEAAYGQDCYGEQLSAGERMRKGLEAAVAVVGFLGRLGRLADESVQTVSRMASCAYNAISARVSQLKRA